MKKMHRSGFEPELLAWKAKVIAARPSVLDLALTELFTLKTFVLFNFY